MCRWCADADSPLERRRGSPRSCSGYRAGGRYECSTDGPSRDPPTAPSPAPHGGRSASASLRRGDPGRRRSVRVGLGVLRATTAMTIGVARAAAPTATARVDRRHHRHADRHARRRLDDRRHRRPPHVGTAPPPVDVDRRYASAPRRHLRRPVRIHVGERELRRRVDPHAADHVSGTRRRAIPTRRRSATPRPTASTAATRSCSSRTATTSPPTSTRPLLERWAAAGYVVAAPTFPILSGIRRRRQPRRLREDVR